jgi:hypothetical protein
VRLLSYLDSGPLDLADHLEPFPLNLLEVSMASDAILSEVEHLNGVCERLEGLAERTPRLTTELLTIAGNVRSVATLLAVLMATRLHGIDGNRSD